MPTAVLSPIPEQDPRPNVSNIEVIARAIEEVSDDLVAWVHQNVNSKASSLNIEAVVIACIRESELDAFKTGVKLQTAMGWSTDIALVRIIDRAMTYLEMYSRLMTAEWAFKNSIRFPAKEGDKITWVSSSGRSRTGTVIAVNGASAFGLVNPRWGGVVRVLAEEVTSNETQGRRAGYPVKKKS